MKNKQTSSKDVAREAGVSQATVSYVLNNTPNIKIKPETRRLVLDAAKKLNYHTNFIARSMRLKKSSTIGVVTSKTMSSFIFMNVLDGIKTSLVERNYSITLCSSPHEGIFDAEYVKYYNSRLIDGVIFVFTSLNEEEKNYLSENNVPYVMINSHPVDDAQFQVKTSIEKAIDESIAYLVERGVTEIGFLGNSAEKPNSQRYLNYLNSLEKQGLEFNSKLVKRINNNEERLESEIGVFFEQLDRVPKAIICDGINTGLYTLRYVNKNNIKIPEQTSIISIGTSQFSQRAYPSLSAIEAPLYEMGVNGAKMLFEQLDGVIEDNSNPAGISEDVITLEWSFVKRESC